MSLQYIIDGYNIINHPLFIRRHKHIENLQLALLKFIEIRRLTGSAKNKITVVFDGYADSFCEKTGKTDINVIFSRKETADERIKKIVEASSNPKTIIVVSDDKEIKFFVSSCGARAMSIEEFFKSKEKLKPKEEQADSLKLEISYSQMHKINQELKKIWLE